VTITRAAAIAAMKETFFQAWKQGSPAFNNGTVVSVVWDNREDKDAPDPTKPKCEFQIKHADQPLVTIAPKGQRRYRANGSIFATVCVPLGKGTYIGEGLSKVISDALRGTALAGGDAVTMRKAVIRELGRLDRTYFEWLVQVDFDYDELG
jgi:hypothetical protein